jgi:ubiquinone biosynthesis protein
MSGLPKKRRRNGHSSAPAARRIAVTAPDSPHPPARDRTGARSERRPLKASMLTALPSRHVGAFDQLRRSREIAAVLVKYGFVDAVDALHLTSPLAAGRRLLARPPDPPFPRARRIRLALEELGPTFVKFGQALSTRADLLPHDLVAELSLLQDSLPPLPPGVAERAIQDAFGRPLTELFLEFDPQPIAAASIAQVHRATLRSGATVAVKVRRPGLSDTIERDLAILAHLADLASRHLTDAALYSLPELVAEFARTIRLEQDLSREARIIARIASQFDGDPTVRFPAICWPLTTPEVLTMEFLEGVKVSAVASGNRPDLDASVIARRGADAILTQILVHGLFHADPHPGNVLILPDNVVAFVDFGIVGRIDRRMREHLGHAIEAIGEHDAERLAEVVLAVATPQRHVDVANLARDLAEILDVYSNVAIGDLSLGGVFTAAADAISRHRLKLPADLLLLVKALVTIEGIGRDLDPDFKIVAHAAPLVQRLAIEEHRPEVLARRMVAAAGEAAGIVRGLPRDVADLARKARADQLQIQFVHRNLDYFVRELDRSSNRLSFAVVIAAVVIGSAVILNSPLGTRVAGYSALGVAGFLVAAVLAVGLAIGILRSGRL